MGERPGSDPVLRTPATDRTDDLAGALSQAVTALFGATSLAVEVLLRALADSRPGPQTQRDAGPVAADAADLVLGVGWRLTVLVGQATTGVARVTRPVVGVVIDPPLVPRGLRPVAVMGRLRSGWASERPRAVRTLASWSSTAAPLAAEVTTSLVDVDRVAAVVLSRVDVTGLVAEVVDRLDVEKVAAGVLERVDVDRLLVTAIDRIDLQALVERALARLDLNEVVATALDGLDLRPLSRDVVGRLDVDGLAGDALDQIDLTQLVLRRIDMERLVTAALDSLDLTQLVLSRVDLERIVTAALDELDLTQLVMQRVDLPGVADYVVDEIDLPEIIRESTGSMASETIQGVRLQGIEADRAVNRVVDRMLWRRRARRTAAVDLDHSEDRPDSDEEPPDEH